MSNGQEKDSKTADPFEPFRTMRDAYLDAMAKTMVEAVNTETYAQTTGAMLEASLTAAAPLREAMEKSMLQALQQLSLPSRQEIAALAERFTNVELRLDDVDAKLDSIVKMLRSERSAPGTGGEDALRVGVQEGAAQPGRKRAGAAPGRPEARRRFTRRAGK